MAALYALRTVALVGLLCVAGFAEDMLLTLDDGSEIALHDNYTWNYKNKKGQGLREDTEITLNDGVRIVVTRKGEWGYGEDMDGAAPGSEITMHTAYATGMSRQADVSNATIEALEVAFRRLADQLIKGIWTDGVVDSSNLVDCVERAGKEVKKTEQKVKDGWQVSVNVRVDREAILAIADCVAKSDPPAEPE